MIHGFGDVDWRAARDDLYARGFVDDAGRLMGGGCGRPSIPRPDRRLRLETALGLWNGTTGPASAGAAGFYLRRRAVQGVAAACNLRLHPSAPTSVYRPGGSARPALIARISDADDRLTAVELTYLDPNGLPATGLRLGRKTVGQVPPGAAVRLSPPATENLRGLGPASTLVLVNGRRMAGTGFRGDFSDISAMPSVAVERVDVLLDGASALYGADAVAGVVNVIMRRSFDGLETRLRASAAKGGAEDLVGSVVGGRSWSSGSAYLAYEAQTVNAVNSQDRPYTADGDLRPFGGTDRRLTFSAPGNLVVFNPATASYVSQFAIRPNASGSAQSAADFVAGSANLQAPSLGADLLPGVERQAAYGAVRQQIGDRLELTADARYNKRNIEYAGPASIGLMTVTAANPFFISPTGAASQMVGYSFVRDLGNPRQSLGSESFGVTAGASYDLGARWSLEGYVSFAGEEGSVRVPERVNTRFLNEALGVTPDDAATAYGAARDGYFNPYGTGTANSATVLDFISSGFSETHDRSRASSANLLVQGPIFTLPGGDVQLAVGAQARRETFQASSTTFSSTPAPVSTSTPERARNIEAVFAEARIPIVGADNARPRLVTYWGEEHFNWSPANIRDLYGQIFDWLETTLAADDVTGTKPRTSGSIP